MVATETPICDVGWKAVDFDLEDPDGRRHRLADVRGVRGTLVMFICNHCPYVRAVVDRLVRDVRDLQAHGVGAIAVMPNDYRRYPEDAPAKMKAFAAEHGFTFPYVIDRTQDVARRFGAVCTPDFFGFDADLALRYRGRLDASGRSPVEGGKRELYEAMCQVAQTGRGPEHQIASMGCSIKWRET
ncbi:MAG: thioredoxin family protein [Rhodospirillales bacterium]